MRDGLRLKCSIFMTLNSNSVVNIYCSKSVYLFLLTKCRIDIVSKSKSDIVTSLI